MDLSIIIPAYNEEDNIKITIVELLSVVSKLPEIDKVKIIVVDDHSSDNTFEIVRQMDDVRVECLRLSRRCGSHTALRAGLKNVTADAVLYISADGQDNPACLENMLNKWRNGTGIVWALRKNRNNEPFHIKRTAQLFYKLLAWFNKDGIDTTDFYRADFYLLDKSVIDAVNSCPEKNTSIFGLISWLGFKQDFVEYDRRERRFGKSKWNFKSRFKLALDWIMAFSGLPLRLMSVIGIIVASIGFLYAIFIIIRAIHGRPIAGWASTMIIILVLGGIQMIMLGIIGEYLWRNIEESRNRPLYFIEKDTFKPKK